MRIVNGSVSGLTLKIFNPNDEDYERVCAVHEIFIIQMLLCGNLMGDTECDDDDDGFSVCVNAMNVKIGHNKQITMI